METSLAAETHPNDAPVHTYAERRAQNRLPLRPWMGFAVGVPIAAGIAWGAGREHDARRAIVRATFLGSAMGYLTTSLMDFALHFRMEKERTGRFLGFQVVPKGESANHVVTIATLLSILALAREPRRRPALRDWWSLSAPALFLVLGWRDELVYHRKRSDHREDMLHTVAHLAAGVMLTSFATLRTACWTNTAR